jgi:purine-binding chemotaxis protein CheW
VTLLADDERILLTFRVVDRRLAVDPARVAEVVRRPPLTRVPHAPLGLVGVANVRGRIVPVIALAQLLGLAEKDVSLDRLIVLDGPNPVGLAVDEVTGLKTGVGDLSSAHDDGFVSAARLDALLEGAFAAFRRGSASNHTAPHPQRAPSEPSAEIALLAFELADQPYALPLETVREVTAAPPDLARLPGTDAAMLGVTNVRGVLTPVVSARVLLGLPSAPLGPEARVVITAVGEATVGVAVDRVSAILRAPPTRIGAVPGLLNRGAGEARVVAMLRTDLGRLVAVLDPERLFAEESMAQILEDGRVAAEDTARATEGATFRRFLVFTLKHETYGVDIAAVEEVVRLPPNLSRLPKAPPYILGVMSWRGAPLPVIDQRRRFDLGDALPKGGVRVIVMRVGDSVAGFAVDSVTSIRAIPTTELRPTPELAQEASRLFEHVADAESGDGIILLLNPRELLDRAEAELLASLAADTPAS